MSVLISLASTGQEKNLRYELPKEYKSIIHQFLLDCQVLFVNNEEMLEEPKNNSADEKAALMQEIHGAIWEVAEKKEIEKVRSLSRHSPEKVASILYLYSTYCILYSV